MAAEKRLILIIDDAEENLEILSVKLLHLGYAVETAASGEAGVVKALERKPDLILLDIMLPKMDGWEVLSRLKSDKRTQDVPVVVMTAYTSIQYTGEKQRSIEMGAVDYLKKPFDLAEMAEIVARHMKN